MVKVFVKSRNDFYAVLTNFENKEVDEMCFCAEASNLTNYFFAEAYNRAGGIEKRLTGLYLPVEEFAKQRRNINLFFNNASVIKDKIIDAYKEKGINIPYQCRGDVYLGMPDEEAVSLAV